MASVCVIPHHIAKHVAVALTSFLRSLLDSTELWWQLVEHMW